MVMAVPGLTPTQKLVLMAVTLRTNSAHDDSMWASQSTIAAEVGTTRETVNATLRLLEERGLLSRSPRYRSTPEGGQYRSTDYVRVNYTALVENQPGGVASDHTPGDVRPQLNKERNQEEKVHAAAPHARAARTAPAAQRPRVKAVQHRVQAQRVVECTRARSVHGVAAVIAWGVAEHQMSPDDVAEKLIELGSSGSPVSIASLSQHLEDPAAAPPPQPSAEQAVEQSLAAGVRAHRLRALAAEHPEVALGVAVLLEASEQRAVKCTLVEADRVEQELRGLCSSPPTPGEVVAAGRGVAAAGGRVGVHTVEHWLRTGSVRR